ncbi:hypothetical protein [Levilactobacillus suantsaiihabitans]|uniref:hypothetical protein n=1 Tax=Levilactobacillus suantsaiihabitans TaxID=2487722 RepID=UPI00107F0697|nr:hypothetical protein [Levilactobacillus suantsaiihabitans]
MADYRATPADETLLKLLRQVNASHEPMHIQANRKTAPQAGGVPQSRRLVSPISNVKTPSLRQLAR